MLDKSFRQFDEMSAYVEGQGLSPWQAATEKPERKPPSEWTVDLMNRELTELVTDFTKERAAYCRDIIQKVYGVNVQTGAPARNRGTAPSGSPPKTSRPPQRDYGPIVQSCRRINEIVRIEISPDGKKVWKIGNNDSLEEEAKKLLEACRNIKKQGGNNRWH